MELETCEASSELAALCSAALGQDVRPDPDWPSAYIVKTTGTHRVIVYPGLVNWRLARVELGPYGCPDRGWCYFGLGPDSFMRAMAGAALWDGADDTRPTGWDKDAHTGEYGRPSDNITTTD